MSDPTLTQRIAHLALDTFDSLPQKCKPRILHNGRREWTPLSAITLSCPNGAPSTWNTLPKDPKIISLATGTKSLPVSALPKCDGLILHDCHAEILALRGLNYWLLCEMEKILQNDNFKSDWLDTTTTAHDARTTVAVADELRPRPFNLKAGVEVSLFSTTAPCGDASMELLIAAARAAGHDISPWTECAETLQQQQQQQMSSDNDNRAEAQALSLPLGRGYFSKLGALRRKPARADAEISLSKSCADKLMLKQFTGVLSCPVDLLVEPDDDEVFLKRLVVYPDQYDRVGYERAFAPNGRLQRVVQSEVQGQLRCQFFDVEVLPEQFRCFDFNRVKSMGKDESEKRVTSNISALWVAEGDKGKSLAEALVNGVKQGYRQFDHRNSKGSAVCRRNMAEKAMNITKLLQTRKAVRSPWLKDLLMPIQNSALKSLPVRGQSREVKRLVLDSLGGWPEKTADDDFLMTSSTSSDEQKDHQICLIVCFLAFTAQMLL